MYSSKQKTAKFFSMVYRTHDCRLYLRLVENPAMLLLLYVNSGSKVMPNGIPTSILAMDDTEVAKGLY